MGERKDIGGYFGFEKSLEPLIHAGDIALNSGRNCLAYLTELRHIETIWIPDFICDSVFAIFKKYGVETKTYCLTDRLLPDYLLIRPSSHEWLLLMDYYGQLLSKDVEQASCLFDSRIIIDETQAYFAKPYSVADSIYTCRKWFGVSDGAYVRTHDGKRLDRDIPIDESYDRMTHILGRCDRGASEFYEDYRKSEECFSDLPIMKMSKLTKSILSLLDYDFICTTRKNNWKFVARKLGDSNQLSLHDPEVPFMYPYMIEGACDIRRRLVDQGIFIPLLWPNVVYGQASHQSKELAENILPLPIDQRYDLDDMEFMLSVLEKCLC